MDKNMTLEKRIAAELYSYQGKMSVFVDDLQGHTVEVGADEEFETASTIKAFILAALYLQAQRGKARQILAEIHNISVFPQQNDGKRTPCFLPPDRL